MEVDERTFLANIFSHTIRIWVFVCDVSTSPVSSRWNRSGLIACDCLPTASVHNRYSYTRVYFSRAPLPRHVVLSWRAREIEFKNHCLYRRTRYFRETNHRSQSKTNDNDYHAWPNYVQYVIIARGFGIVRHFGSTEIDRSNRSGIFSRKFSGEKKFIPAVNGSVRFRTTRVTRCKV